MPGVTVLMPTFKQAAFIRRAIDSLLAQTLNDWELIILDDGSPDQTGELVKPYLEDARIQYRHWDENRGLGAALNAGLELSSSPFISYLPADDVYHADHLESLVGCLDNHSEAVLVYSGVRYNYNRYTESVVEGLGLQLVQVAHRWVDQRWMERSELVTDDLDRMYWQRLQPLGEFLSSGKITAEWVSHPDQRHKRLREPEGGVQEPLRFHTRVENFIDEEEHYRRFRERSDTPPAADGLKILLVGELAYNPGRVLALEEAGHQLFGLWMEDPYWYNCVGPLPFGDVQDLSRHSWQEEIRQIQPDVIYALLNWQAVPFAHHVLQNHPGVPFVWHFAEGPFITLEKGHWSKLVDLYQHSQGQIYTSPEMRDWFETILPGSVNPDSSLIQFTFDDHVERLTAFFRQIIHQWQERNGSTPIQRSALQPEEHAKSTI